MPHGTAFKMKRLGYGGIRATTAQEFDAFTKRDVARWTKVIKEARIQPE